MRKGKGFVLQDDYDTTCIKCRIEQDIVELPIKEIPKKVLLQSIHWYDFRVYKCPKCNQKAIQFFELTDN